MEMVQEEDKEVEDFQLEKSAAISYPLFHRIAVIFADYPVSCNEGHRNKIPAEITKGS